jgi:hypothetical protein
LNILHHSNTRLVGSTGEFTSSPSTSNLLTANLHKVINTKDLLEQNKPERAKRILNKNTMLGEYHRAGVYLLYYQSVVVYVGQSICPYQRIYQHIKDKLFDEFRVMHCAKNRRMYWEERLMKHFQPKYNKTCK